MIAEPLGRVLEATGLLGERRVRRTERDACRFPVRTPGCLPSLPTSGGVATPMRTARAVGGVGLTVYFKYVDEPRDVADWQREIWNRDSRPCFGSFLLSGSSSTTASALRWGGRGEGEPA